MKSLAMILLFALAAPVWAAERDGPAEGDIEEYDPISPPSLVLEEVYLNEIDTKTFVLVEGSLFVPDTISIREGQDVYNFEVVDEQELERFESIAQIRFPEVLRLKDQSSAGRHLVRFEQKMWRKALRVAFREYQTTGGTNVRYTAFRVTFESCGDFYRATLTLYKSKATLADHLSGVAGRIGQMLNEIAQVQQEVVRVENAATTAVSGLAGTVQTLDGAVTALDSKVGTLDSTISSIESRVSSLEQAQSD